MLATHVTEDLPLDSTASPYGDVSLITDERARSVRLAQLGGVIEAQRGIPGVKVGRGINQNAFDLLVSGGPQSAGSLAADVVAVKAAAHLETLTLVPDFGIEYII